MNKIPYLITLLLLFSNSIFCQNLNPKELSEKIFNLNNDHKYQESIVILEEIIDNPKSTKYDLYNAYLQKSFTYKRLYNYSQASNNLILALKEGSLSAKKEEVITRILIEQLFINFDLQKYNEVQQLLSEIKKQNIQLIEAETRASYISVLAVMYMRNNDFTNAEVELNKAIKILEKEDPKHLPNIYRKKMGLYNHIHQEDKVMKAFDTGLFYAKKYNSDLYEIIMYETLTSYYSENEDYENAFLNQKIVSDLRTKYNAENQSGKLHILEKNLIGKRNSLQLRYEKNIRVFLTVLSLILVVLIVLIYLLFKVNKQKRILVEKENKILRNELMQLTQEYNDKGEAKLDLEKFDLTERQIEIINRVKEGKTNKEIGSELYISENTVKYHLKIIYAVLEIENRSFLK